MVLAMAADGSLGEEEFISDMILTVIEHLPLRAGTLLFMNVNVGTLLGKEVFEDLKSSFVVMLGFGPKMLVSMNLDEEWLVLNSNVKVKYGISNVHEEVFVFSTDDGYGINDAHQVFVVVLVMNMYFKVHGNQFMWSNLNDCVNSVESNGKEKLGLLRCALQVCLKQGLHRVGGLLGKCGILCGVGSSFRAGILDVRVRALSTTFGTFMDGGETIVVYSNLTYHTQGEHTLCRSTIMRMGLFSVYVKRSGITGAKHFVRGSFVHGTSVMSLAQNGTGLIEVEQLLTIFYVTTSQWLTMVIPCIKEYSKLSQHDLLKNGNSGVRRLRTLLGGAAAQCAYAIVHKICLQGLTFSESYIGVTRNLVVIIMMPGLPNFM